MNKEETCSRCNGTGKLLVDDQIEVYFPCHVCNGTGEKQRNNMKHLKTRDGRNLVCECGHSDRRHADTEGLAIKDGWGDGECELCGCKAFRPIIDTTSGKEEQNETVTY